MTFLKSLQKIVQNVNHPAKSSNFLLEVGTPNVNTTNLYFHIVALVIRSFDLLNLGMTEVDEIRITSNKIDRIEEHAFPSRNTVTSLILEGNHVLEVPPLSALEDIEVEKVR